MSCHMMFLPFLVGSCAVVCQTFSLGFDIIWTCVECNSDREHWEFDSKWSVTKLQLMEHNFELFVDKVWLWMSELAPQNKISEEHKGMGKLLCAQGGGGVKL